MVDDGWAFSVEPDLCYDPKLVLGGNWGDATHFDYAEGVDAGRFWATGERFAHTGWSTFIRRMILSDVNIFGFEVCFLNSSLNPG